MDLTKVFLEEQADEGDCGQGLTKRVEQVLLVQLPSHDHRVRTSGFV